MSCECIQGSEYAHTHPDRREKEDHMGQIGFFMLIYRILGIQDWKYTWICFFLNDCFLCPRAHFTNFSINPFFHLISLSVVVYFLHSLSVLMHL